jgi:hypothetical protein
VDRAAFCSACGTPVGSDVAPTKGDDHSAAVSAAIEGDGRVRFRLGLAAAALGVLLLGIVVVVANRRSTPDGSPAAVSFTDGRAFTDPVKRNLFQHSRSCPLTQEWNVDFAGNSLPYRVEQRHCNAQQLSGFDMPKSQWVQNEHLEMGYDFLLVLKPSLNELVHGELEEGAYSSVEPLRLENREYLAVNGQIWGTSGDHEWCLLAQQRDGQLSCWHEQKGDLDKYLRASLWSHESAKAGWSIAGKDGRVFMESYVEAPGDANCCPSRGKIQVDLTPKDGVLLWSKVTRLASDNESNMVNSAYDAPAPVETPAPAATPAPAEMPEVVTPDTLYRFPKLYQNRRIQLVGWEWAMVQTAKSAHVEGPLIPPECKYVLNFARPGLGCASTIPEHLLNPFGVANEEDIDLTCTVARVTNAGSLLTHCELSPSSSRKMKDREYELETGKSPYPQPSKEDSKYADAQLPMDASKYRPIEIHPASCSRLPDNPDTMMCVSSAAVRDKGAYITLNGVPAPEGDVSLTCFSGKWESCRRLAYQTYGFEVTDDGTHSQECEVPSWLAHGMLEGKRTGCIKIHAQPHDLIYIIADGPGLCGHGNPQTCW